MDKKLIKKLLLIVLLTNLSFLAACSSTSPHLAAKIQAAGFLNPNIYNQASPVVVTIYQLKSATAFQQANFFALNNNSIVVLGSDLLDKHDLEIRPEQQQTLRLILSPATNYIGVIAAFRNPDTAQWREVVSVKAGKNVKLQINLTTQSVTVQKK